MYYYGYGCGCPVLLDRLTAWHLCMHGAEDVHICIYVRRYGVCRTTKTKKEEENFKKTSRKLTSIRSSSPQRNTYGCTLHPYHIIIKHTFYLAARFLSNRLLAVPDRMSSVNVNSCSYSYAVRLRCSSDLADTLLLANESSSH